jgi:hypothetical protein
MAKTSFKKLQLSRTWSAPDLQELILDRYSGSDSSNWISYIGVPVDQFFYSYLIHNISSVGLYYSVLLDEGDEITVDATHQDGVKYVPPNSAIAERGEEQIRRLRMYLDGSGHVEISLYGNIAPNRAW